ncbi:MAG: hypothetical protein JW900_06350 [Anaerolineae bacterium]|nr:hypothetical protein [Anaerolineae bacterium]
MIFGTGNQAFSLKGVILVLVGVGLALGLALMDSDLVNPLESMAQYERERVENQRAAERSEIDIQHYAALQEAQTQAELQRIADETAYLQQLHQEELERARLAHEQELQAAWERERVKQQVLQFAAYTAITVGGLCMLALGIGRAVYIARLRSVSVPVSVRVPAQAAADAEVWTPEQKRQAREAARQREREERAWALQELAMARRHSELFQGAVQPERARPQSELFENLLSLTT